MSSLRIHRGVSLVDVVVGAALFLIVFTALFGILRASVAVSGLAKLRAAATGIATSQIEYIRSLEYDAVGTVSGIPSGAIPQNATTTQAGVEFSIRTYIVYVDDPADGEGAGDATSITTDYKKVKVEVTYDVQGVERNVTLITNVVPPGVESNVGGGTIRISVVDAQGLAVSGATVRVVNSTLVPSVDVTTFSDTGGDVLFPGAPSSTDYEVYVSKSGYSSAETYERDAVNQNPTPGYLTVVEGSTTTGTFAIDILSTLVVHTFSPAEEETFSDTFISSAFIHTSSGVEVSAGRVTLLGAPTYGASGEAVSTTTAPLSLDHWTSATATLSAPVGTSVVFQVVDSGGALIPDVVLPGNSLGFTTSVDLSSVATTTYPALALKALLSTSNSAITPEVLDWEIAYGAGPVPLADVSFTLTGSKTIGSEIDGTPIYKTIVATTTDSLGVRTLELEWDSYDLTLPSYTVQSASPVAPYELLPNISVDASLMLTP